MYLRVNDVIAPNGPEKCCIERTSRIIAIYPERDLVFIIAFEARLKMPFTRSLSLLRTELESEKVRVTKLQLSRAAFDGLEKMKPRYGRLLKQSWGRIEAVVRNHKIEQLLDDESRAIIVNDAAKTAKCEPKQIRRDLCSYWAGGQTQQGMVARLGACGPRKGKKQLRSRNPGAKPRVVRMGIVDEKDVTYVMTADGRSRIGRGIRHFIDKARSKTEIWRLTLGHYFSSGFREIGKEIEPILLPINKRPTFRQFQTVWKELDKELELTQKQMTRIEWEQVGKARFARASKQAFGPLHRFEIDATVLDVYVVSRFNRNWIVGRPILYVVIDVYSRMVTGFYLGFEGPNWSGARLALFNAFSNKVEFCARYGVEITEEDWPCHHLPLKLLGDGGELLGLTSDELEKALNIGVENAAPYRGDWKPFVESRFRLVNRARVEFLPGAVDRRLAELKDRGYALDACLTVDEVTTTLIRCFLNANQHSRNDEELPEGMIAQGILNSTPQSVWNWGLENLTCAARSVDPELAYRQMLPKVEGTVRGDGIYIHGKRFSCEYAQANHWFEKARREGSWKVEVRHDPSCLGAALIAIDKKRTFEAAYLIDIDAKYKAARLEELLDLLAMQGLVAAFNSDDKTKAEIKASVTAERLIRNAKQELKATRKSEPKSARLDAIPKNRQIERKAEQLKAVRDHIESRSEGGKRASEVRKGWDLEETDRETKIADEGWDD